MKKPNLIAITIAFAFMTLFSLPAAAADSIIAPGATLEKLAGDFKFTEGATCDREGNVFFTDQPNNRILKWSVEGRLSTFMEPAGRANGMYFDSRGNLIVCADDKTELWSIAPDKKVTVLAGQYFGKYLNGPNDVWVRPDGGLYITDPYYQRDYWQHTAMALDSEQVYYLAPGAKELVRVTTDLKKPNGITGTPDGKKLFIADIGADRTYVYDIEADGSLTNKKLFCSKGSDGMTISERGDILISGHGVFIFDKNGKQIEHIEVPEKWVGNLSFGGKDHRTLFITASTSLYSIQLTVKGANPSK